MQNSINLSMNSLCGIQFRKDRIESTKGKSHNWMETEYGDNVLLFGILPNENYIVKLK